ncbi:hypothetical protein EXU30_07120 [Shewanella maritima]|uniref:Uncharacterized protein n=1 Tax=Shewanella maritima TaxID=2520507 RepID=A0A411PG07_9GAMM|nr:hypothetical protein [Shewanella maritima]QBF82493.1 hypothetical protein EXU30_07120 [Shewanella maritima]
MKTLTTRLNIVVITSMLLLGASLINPALAAPKHASATSEQVIAAQLERIEQKQLVSEMEYEAQIEAEFESQLAKADRKFVSEQCKQYGLKFDKLSGTCLVE